GSSAGRRRRTGPAFTGCFPAIAIMALHPYEETAMHPKHATLGLACVMALAACGDRTPPPATDAPATPAPATTPASPDGNAPAPGASTAPVPMRAPQTQDGQPRQPRAGGQPPSPVLNCSTTIEGNHAVQCTAGPSPML